MLLARDSVGGISLPGSISLPTSLFTRSVIQDPMTKLISHMKLLMMLYYQGGPRDISLSHRATNPSLDPCNPTDTFGDTCRTPFVGERSNFKKIPMHTQDHGEA